MKSIRHLQCAIRGSQLFAPPQDAHQSAKDDRGFKSTVLSQTNDRTHHLRRAMNSPPSAFKTTSPYRPCGPRTPSPHFTSLKGTGAERNAANAPVVGQTIATAQYGETQAVTAATLWNDVPLLLSRVGATPAQPPLLVSPDGPTAPSFEDFAQRRKSFGAAVVRKAKDCVSAIPDE